MAILTPRKRKCRHSIGVTEISAPLTSISSIKAFDHKPREFAGHCFMIKVVHRVDLRIGDVRCVTKLTRLIPLRCFVNPSKTFVQTHMYVYIEVRRKYED